MAYESEYTGLLPEPALDNYWILCTPGTHGIYDSGCQDLDYPEPIDITAEWIYAKLPDWHLPPYSEICNKTYPYGYATSMIRWSTHTTTACTYFDADCWCDLHGIQYVSTMHYELWEQLPCPDEDEQYPTVENDFSYSPSLIDEPKGIWVENHPRIDELYDFCSSVGGQIEEAYFTCLHHNRCKYRDEWSYDPSDGGSWVEDCDNSCIDIVGNTTSNCESTNIYTVILPTRCDINSDVRVNISYVGSTLTNGVDFTGDGYTTILAGNTAASFKVEVHSEKDGTINISLDSEYAICESSVSLSVECDTPDTPDTPEPDELTSCEEIGFFWEPYGHTTRVPSYMN